MKKRRESVSADSYSYSVVFEWREEDGVYLVTCPRLPGLVTYGRTMPQARKMAAEAMKGYLESLRDTGDTIPPSEKRLPAVERMKVTLVSA